MLIGGVLWFNLSADKNSEPKAFSAEGENPNSYDIQMADRDNAAEEVRAIATKINNLEQVIDKQNGSNSLAREQIREVIDEKFEQIMLAVQEFQYQSSYEQAYNSIESLTDRVASLENQEQNQSAGSDEGSSSNSNMVWYTSDELGLSGYSNYSENTIQSAPKDRNNLDDTHNKQVPHYTIPPTTTLIDSTALTALVGRIPIRGKLQDPWRFKVITGADNLAANGHEIPQLVGMLWSGTARGDLSLSCVSGNVDTVTFIFSDGTIQTTRNYANSESTVSGLGWISDEFGNPCIPGELKSNALQFLKQTALVNTVRATAEAIANAQTEVSTTGNGTRDVTSVVGDVNEYIAGFATKESLDGVAQWLANRQLNSFDAIYVPSGQAIAIHIEEPILIDRDPNARKVRRFNESGLDTSAHQGWID